MEKVYLYMCEECGGIKGSVSNHGQTYLMMCKSCGMGQFHNKVLAAQGLNLYKESHFIIGGEGENGSKKEE